MSRTIALLGKELADLRQNLTIFLPSFIVTVIAICIPVFIAVIVPAVTGERLSDSGDLEIALEMYKQDPAMRDLDPEAAIQAYVFQYFLVMLVLGPITSAMSVAAFSVDRRETGADARAAAGDADHDARAARRQGARGAAAGAGRDASMSLVLYLGVIAAASRQTASSACCSEPRTLGIVFLLGPLAGDGRAAAGHLRVVARQRRENRAAARHAS